MKDKNLKYYLGLKYEMIVREVEDELGTDYKVFTRELNPDAFYGIGATPEEAIKSFNEVKEELFPYYLENGLEIPEPTPVDESMPSGKFVLRIPPRLHKRLIAKAKRSKQSLNALVCSTLEKATSFRDVVAELRDLKQSIAGLSTVVHEPRQNYVFIDRNGRVREEVNKKHEYKKTA